MIITILEYIADFFYSTGDIFQAIANHFKLKDMQITYAGKFFKNYLKEQYIDGPFKEENRVDAYEEKIDFALEHFSDDLTRQECAEKLYEALDSVDQGEDK